MSTTTPQSPGKLYHDLSPAKKETITALLHALTEHPEAEVCDSDGGRASSFAFRERVAENAGYSPRNVSKVIDENPTTILSRAARLQLDFSEGCHPIKLLDESVLNDVKYLHVTDTAVTFTNDLSEPDTSEPETTDSENAETWGSEETPPSSDDSIPSDASPGRSDETDELPIIEEGLDEPVTESAASLMSLRAEWSDELQELDYPVPESTIQVAEDIFRTATEDGIHEDIGADSVMYGAVAAAVRKEAIPVEKTELAGVFDISPDEMYQYRARLSTTLELGIPPVGSEPYLDRYLDELDVSPELRGTATDLHADLTNSDGNSVVSGHAPSKTAAAILYAASLVEDGDLTQSQLIESTAGSEYTIRKRYKDVIESSADRLGVSLEQVRNAKTVRQVQALLHDHYKMPPSGDETDNAIPESSQEAYTELTGAKRRCVDALLHELCEADWGEISDEDYVTGLTNEFRDTVGGVAGHSTETVTRVIRLHKPAIQERVSELAVEYSQEDIETLLDEEASIDDSQIDSISREDGSPTTVTSETNEQPESTAPRNDALSSSPHDDGHRLSVGSVLLLFVGVAYLAYRFVKR
jgi:hypothetical protein